MEVPASRWLRALDLALFQAVDGEPDQAGGHHNRDEDRHHVREAASIHECHGRTREL